MNQPCSCVRSNDYVMNVMLMLNVKFSIKGYVLMICFMNFVYANMILFVILNRHTWMPCSMEVLLSTEYEIIIIINNFYNYLSIAIDR